MNRGFSLVELLVTISILFILSSIVLVSASSGIYKTNDSKRRTDLIMLQAALERYYSNNSYTYPSTGGSWYGVEAPAAVQSGNNWIPGLVADGDIAALPQDPQYPKSSDANYPSAGGWPGMYIYKSDGSSYAILSHVPANSSVGTTASTDRFYDPNRPTWAWKVCGGPSGCGY